VVNTKFSFFFDRRSTAPYAPWSIWERIFET
jgi:hypothetical protein